MHYTRRNISSQLLGGGGGGGGGGAHSVPKGDAHDMCMHA